MGVCVFICFLVSLFVWVWRSRSTPLGLVHKIEREQTGLILPKSYISETGAGVNFRVPVQFHSTVRFQEHCNLCGGPKGMSK